MLATCMILSIILYFLFGFSLSSFQSEFDVKSHAWSVIYIVN